MTPAQAAVRPGELCREYHVIATPHGDFWAQVEVTISPLLPAEGAQEWPYPVRPGLGEDIAGLIREDVGNQT